MRDRIRPPKEHHELLNDLIKNGVFLTRQKAMMFAAALGHKREPQSEVKPLDSTGEGIPISIFDRAGDSSFIDALAVTVTGSLSVLKSEHGDKRLEIFEHFAQLGLGQLSKACYQGTKDPLMAVCHLLDENSDWSVGAGDSAEVDETVRELGKLL